jgi:hypothetical protein
MKSWRFFALPLLFLILVTGEVQANLVLKVIAVNPSKEQTQKVPVKTVLPKEVRPEDVIDKGELEIVYDTQQGCYVAFGEYELKPGETLEKDIEIRDIWVIPTSEIEGINKDLVKLSDLLKNTEFSDRLAFLKNNIESKLNQVTESQKDLPSNPEELISNYRENLKILESAKADLALVRSFLAQLRPFPAATIWRIILLIIVFLGLLGGSFYLLWQKQLKNIVQHDTFFASEKKEEFVTELKPERHEAKEEKGFQTKDVDKILGEEEKPK